jgi:redox-sensitive bicupin YhaK (pirin superfamily)
MPDAVPVVRVYSDARGETHFEELAVPLAAADFAPPAPPVHLSALAPASRWGFLRVPPGWDGDWHPAPVRMVTVYLAGEVEVEVSDGAVRRFRPGDVVLAEDTTGRGHRSRVVGAAAALLAVVQLPA